MRARRIPPHLLRRGGLGLAMGALLTGVVLAQPTPPPAPAASPAPPTPIPGAPPEEAVPPAESTAADPLPTGPVEAKDVAPAAPPKEQVAEKPAAAPMRRDRYDVAILQALDKVTAETLRFEAAVGRPVRWKGLVFTVRACERSAPDEAIDDAIVYLTIDAQPRPQPRRPTPPPKQAFKGWMFASSPGLNPVQHATYDAWVINCRARAPAPAVASAPVRPPAAKAPPPETPKVLDLPPAKAPEAEPPVITPPPKAVPPAEPEPPTP